MVGKRRLRSAGPPPAADEALPLCPLCGRTLLPDASTDVHHWRPRSQGGRTAPGNTAAMHRICHRKLHATFSEAELARRYCTPEALRAHPDIAAFIRWLAGKPPGYLDRVRKPRR